MRIYFHITLPSSSSSDGVLKKTLRIKVPASWQKSSYKVKNALNFFVRTYENKVAAADGKMESEASAGSGGGSGGSDDRWVRHGAGSAPERALLAKTE